MILKKLPYSTPSIGDEVLIAKNKKHGKKTVNTNKRYIVLDIEERRFMNKGIVYRTVMALVHNPKPNWIPLHRLVKTSEARVRNKYSNIAVGIDEEAPKGERPKRNEFKRSPLSQFIRECINDQLTKEEARKEWEESFGYWESFDKIWLTFKEKSTDY